MGLFFVIVVVVGVAAWAVVKTGELSGTGRDANRVSFRNPHGRLVATYCEAPVEPVPFGTSVRQAFPWVTGLVTVAFSFAAALVEGTVNASVGATLMTVAASVAPVLLVSFESFLRIGDKGKSFVLYLVVLVGSSVGGAVVGAPLYALLSDLEPSPWVQAAYCAATDCGYAVGAAVAAGAVGHRTRFRRRFADGHEDAVEVSTRSTAYLALSQAQVGKDEWDSMPRER